MSSESPVLQFSDLNLSPALLAALKDVGYETPSPIQAATIPILLGNGDVLGQAQTGTGKTAAFALPILSRIDIRQTVPQALVLAPTRELAIQVAEAFQTYAAHIPGFHVLPIYGGQSYGPQLSALRRGVHVIVGTPGRVIDHLEKGSLDLSKIKTLVLDEADEMLRMGFIDDVETILQKTPATRQTALFSATLPSAIKRIAQTYLRNPQEVTIAAKTGTADNIRQRYWLVSGMHKLDALTRILEAEPFDGMIIFARTKLGTEELASKLQARGFSAAAINGDLAQVQRERTIGQLKDGKIDILVATDVAARGLDVERISHVINYDVPHDPEGYTHRIGRTGRAGRSGEAILFITPREKGLLKTIERATRQPISPLTLPTVQAVNDVRIAKFKDQISETLAAGGLEVFATLIEDFEREMDVPAIEIAAALAKLARGDVPLLLDKNQRETMPSSDFSARERDGKSARPAKFERADSQERSSDRSSGERAPRRERVPRVAEGGMATYRIEVGHAHGVKPGNIVGAIANEAGMDAKNIGRIEIFDDYSVLDMPANMPDELLGHLKSVWVAGQQLHITREGAPPPAAKSAPKPAFAPVSAPEPARAVAPAFAADSAGVNLFHPASAPKPTAAKKAPQAVTTATAPEQEYDADAREAKTLAKAAKSVGKAKPERKGDLPMQSFRIEVGSKHGVKPANIVGAIANEAGLEARHIGRIEIFETHSTLDLPDGMPKDVMEHLKKVWVGGQQLHISYANQTPGGGKEDAAKSAFGPRVEGGNRRVAEKADGGKPPKKADFAGDAKPAKKPHRKGLKPV